MSVVVLRKLVPLKNSQTNINLEVAWQVEMGGGRGGGGGGGRVEEAEGTDTCVCDSFEKTNSFKELTD